jgi:hypothetical protein
LRLRVGRFDGLPNAAEDIRLPTHAKSRRYEPGLKRRNEAPCLRRARPADSWFGRIALSLTGGSAWTRWDPERESPEAIDRLKRELEVLFADSRKRAGDFVERLAQGITVGTLFGIKKETAVGLVKALLNRAAPPLIQLLQNWKVLNIDSMIDRYGDQVAVTLAPHLELPLSVVAEALKRMMRNRLRLRCHRRRRAWSADQAVRPPGRPQ